MNPTNPFSGNAAVWCVRHGWGPCTCFSEVLQQIQPAPNFPFRGVYMPDPRIDLLEHRLAVIEDDNRDLRERVARLEKRLRPSKRIDRALANLGKTPAPKKKRR